VGNQWAIMGIQKAAVGNIQLAILMGNQKATTGKSKQSRVSSKHKLEEKQ
jgi:hypothetical protein